MYSVVLLMAATTGMESTSCFAFLRNHRHHRRDYRWDNNGNGGCCCVPPPCCGCNGEAPPTDGGGTAAATKLTAAEEKMLKELKAKFADTLDAKGLKDYDAWFRSKSSKERADEYKEQINKDAPEDIKTPPALTKEEEKQLGELLGVLKYAPPKDEQYKKWYIETATPEDRAKEYKRLIKAAPEKDKGAGGKSSQLDAPARLLVRLPADAVLTIDGKTTRSTSDSRVFQSPSLSYRGVHFYELQATVERGGMQVQVNRLVRVWAGETTEVNIEVPSAPYVLFQR
jgi:uncharacterized protein (TIGR03000 family)